MGVELVSEVAETLLLVDVVRKYEIKELVKEEFVATFTRFT